MPLTTDPLIVDARSESPPAIGGKGRNLWQLSRQGFAVPAWFALPTDLYRAATADIASTMQRTLARIDFAQAADVRRASRALAELIMTTTIPEASRQAIIAAKNQLGPAGTFLAVRSSAADEDGADHSFAGQMDSFLFVQDDEDLLRRIRQCWASVYSERALSYRHLNGLPLDQVAVGVIVQVMVDAEVSGVMFTADPTTGDPDRTVISATWGLGEGLVSGQVDADTFALKDGTWTIETAQKAETVVFDAAAGSGTRREAVSAELQLHDCLDETALNRVAEAGARIQAVFGPGQDIEFALASGELFILQARPITNLPIFATGHEILWDNSNITESYAGVTSPLTFTFASQAYHVVYHQFCAVMGVAPAVIQENQPVLRNMLGLIKGRVYYNLNHWYQVLSLLPGFSSNKAFMEQMMGVKKAAEFQAPKTSRLTALRLAWRMGRNYLGLDRQVAAFQSRFETHYGRYQRTDFGQLRPDEILASYRDLERHLLWHWRAPLINDFFAMIFYGLLKKLVANWGLDAAGSLHNDLLCGEGGIESTEPTKAILRMAVTVRQQPELKALFDLPDDAILARLRSDPAGQAFAATLDDYLARYGFRCMNELKLEEPNLKENPAFVLTMIRNYLNRESLDVGEMEAREQELRRRAEATAFGKLAGRPVKGALFRWVLANTRRTIKNRENLRFARTKIFGVVREMFLAIGGHFAKRRHLNEAADIFALNLDEIFGFIEGRATCTDLRGLAALRRAEFDRYRAETAGDRFTTKGVVYDGNAFEDEPLPDDGNDDPSLLKGTSCCPGAGPVQGPVRVILSPKDDMRLNGEILVAERTDPGWVPLYPSASGILIERGSLLSHSAIVARELGIPTIIGIRNLTRRVADGQTVAMDARQGTVRLDPDKSP